uniref:Uncharacterized protein n=1 Tax=Tanacetum cinerariifolium TaxID=118510 RepID=A0A6L2JSK2_TANCI|nr:hypothetical protein [Tanacetum cinerariifolium]
MLIILQELTEELGMIDRLGRMIIRIRGQLHLLGTGIQQGIRLQRFWAYSLGIQILDSNEEPIKQDPEVHYSYMAKIQELIPTADEATGPIFEKEPLKHVHNNNEYYVFVMEKEHIDQLESINDTYVVKHGDSNTTSE